MAPARHIRQIYATVVMLVLVSGALCVVSAGGAAAGSLLVESEPPGASVYYVDGTLAGQTPLTLSPMGAGICRVRVARFGYLENSQLGTIKAGTRTT